MSAASLDRKLRFVFLKFRFPQHLRSQIQLAAHEPPAEDETLAAQMLRVGAEGSGYVQIGDALAQVEPW